MRRWHVIEWHASGWRYWLTCFWVAQRFSAAIQAACTAALAAKELSRGQLSNIPRVPITIGSLLFLCIPDTQIEVILKLFLNIEEKECG
jgi:hypothetical protein